MIAAVVVIVVIVIGVQNAAVVDARDDIDGGFFDGTSSTSD